MGSSMSGWGRRWWRPNVVGVAALCLAAPLVSAAAVPAAGPSNTYLLAVASNDLSAVTADVTRGGGQVLQAFPVASAVQVSLPAGVAPPAGAVVVPDQEFTFAGVPAAATADPVNTYRGTIADHDGLDGAGVTVAVVDTGVADTGEVTVEHVNVSGGPTGDGLGHGTFLAGLIAGNGASSRGAYQGVAPGATVLDVQVATADGSTSMSQVLAGLQAVADRQATDPSVKVLSLALSTGSPLPPWLDPLTRALERLWARGITVVVAAGNDGADAVTSPASDPTLLAVGSTDEKKTPARSDDTVADFSAFGRTFGATRPDVVVPGVSLVSLRAPGSVADQENPDSRVLSSYFKGTGTSMSSAVAAGAVAALTAVRPQLGPNDVKRLLVGTAYDSQNLSVRTGAGAGEVDLARAARTDVSDTPRLKFEAWSTRYAPYESDAAAWADFTEAWAAGSLRAVVAAWVRLSPQARRWAANAWSLAVLGQSLSMDDADFAARRWAARRWAIQHWSARRWADNEWVARRWAVVDWDARRWAGDVWSARRWAADDWLAFAWMLRTDPTDPVIAGLWQNEDWVARRWAARRWADVEWVARRWAADAWDARRWADYVWDARRWAADDWEARRWADTDWSARRWADEYWTARRWAEEGWAARRWADDLWSARRWADTDWAARRWAAGDWDARRWAEFTFEARRWASEDWSARRWAVTGWVQ